VPTSLPPAPAATQMIGSSHAHAELQAAALPDSSTSGSSSSSAAGGGGLLRVEVCCEHDPSIVHVFTAEPQVRSSCRQRCCSSSCCQQCNNACAWRAVACSGLHTMCGKVGTQQCCAVCLHTHFLPVDLC
jgi:hypothetical protein